MASFLAPSLCADYQQSDDNQQVLKSLSLEDLSKLEVTTVSKEASTAFKTPAAVYVLTREDLARSGATNIPDLLRLVPGVEVAQIASDKWAIGIRGFEGYLSRSVLVMIDGRSVYTPLFAGVYWEMQDTLLEDIDHIEVIRGPGGTIWGSNAVNGVINIITRNSKDTHGTLVSAGGGSVEQGFMGARYGAGDDNLSYRVWAKGFTRAPQFHPDGMNYDDWRRGQAGFRLDWNPNSRDSVMVSGGGYSEEAGSAQGVSLYSPPKLQIVQGNGDFSGQNLVAGWRRTFQSGADIQVHAYFDRTDRQDLNYREVRDAVDIDFIHHIPLGAHDLIWGMGLHVSPSEFTQTVPTVIFTPARETYSIYSGFVQDAVSLVPNRLIVTLGTKLEYNSYSGFEVQPSGRVAWTPTEHNTIWAAATRAVRTPSRIEEGFQFSNYATSLPLYVRLVGDGQFHPEQLVGYELGYRAYVTKTGYFSISSFYNRYNDLLSVEGQSPIVETLPPPQRVILPLLLRNGIAAQTKGAELASLVDLRSWWRLRSSYSYVHLNAERGRTSDDASTVKQLQGDTPQHKVVVQSIFTLPHAVNFDFTYRYVSALPDINVRAYSTGDARISRRLGRNVELSLVGQDLFQPEHPEYGSIGIRRSAYLRLLWTK
ncbi:MAG TPA: TonB-dependent receptor [Candidatus Sulfopaludibacter sp.]|nr:TonB-dependent receptor [Candidatus Sulfopaludibacter sp.]